MMLFIWGASSFKSVLIGLAQIGVHGLPQGIVKSGLGADRGVPREVVLIKSLFNENKLDNFNLDMSFKNNEKLYHRLMEYMYPITYTSESNIYLVESNQVNKQYELCRLIGKELNIRVYNCG